MDSKRRMLEIHVWNLPHFSELEPPEKLFYWFLYCHCDNVGVYRHNPRLVQFHCGDEIDLKSFVEAVNLDENRLELISNDLVWIKDFVRDTWGTLAAGNNLGLSAYKLLIKHNLLERFIEDYPQSINTESFQEYIQKAKEGDEKKKAYANLPLPQGSPKAGAGLGQGSGKLGTINNPINKSNNISITTPDKDNHNSDKGETRLEFEMRSKGMLEDTPF